MTAYERFNNLHGVRSDRNELLSIIEQAKTENNASVIYRLESILQANPDAKTFLLEIEQFPSTGLSAPRHTGSYKEALDNCGRLRKGFKFENGTVVKVEQKDQKKTKKPVEKSAKETKKVVKPTIEPVLKDQKKTKIERTGKASDYGKKTKRVKKEVETIEETNTTTVPDGSTIVYKGIRKKIPYVILRKLRKNSKKRVVFYGMVNNKRHCSTNYARRYDAINSVEHYINNKAIVPLEKKNENLKTVIKQNNIVLRKGQSGIKSLRNFVAEDKLRPILSGVYLENKTAVATNAHILAILETAYSKKDEKKIINPFKLKKISQDDYFDGVYPNYKAVIPVYESFSDWIAIEDILQKTNEFVEDWKVKKKNSELVPVVKILDRTETYVNLNLLKISLQFLYDNGAEKIKYAFTGKNRAVVLKANNSSVNMVLLMPTFYGDGSFYELYELTKYSEKGSNETATKGLNSSIKQYVLFENGLGNPLVEISEFTPVENVIMNPVVTGNTAQILPVQQIEENYIEKWFPIEEEKQVPAQEEKPKNLSSGAKRLLGTNFDTLAINEEWSELMQYPAANLKIALFGPPKNGKTAGSLQMAEYFTNFGKVLYNFADQGFNLSTQELWKNSGLANNENAEPSDSSTLNDLEREIATGQYKFVFIDMISDYIRKEKLKPEEFKERFIKGFPNVSFILIFEVTKDGNFKGDQGWTHLVDAIFTVKDFFMENRGRYGVGERIIWEEGFQRFNPKRYEEYMREKRDSEINNAPVETVIN